MAYTKFYDPTLNDDISTPVSADWSNHVEQGIFDSAATADAADAAAATAQAAADAAQSTADDALASATASGITGEVRMVALTAAPAGWALCDGSAKKRSIVDPDGNDYGALYDAIGTTFGAGDGSTTFNLPDLRGRAPVGKGTHADVDTLGDNEGEATESHRRPKHKHTAAVGTLATGDDTPDHTHGVNADGSGLGAATVRGGAATTFAPATGGASVRHTHPVTGAPTVGPQTGSEPTDGPAYLTLNFIIKL